MERKHTEKKKINNRSENTERQNAYNGFGKLFDSSATFKKSKQNPAVWDKVAKEILFSSMHFTATINLNYNIF